jgi:hypothetical protein
MRRAAAFLTCLTLAATGCLHQTATLIGLADGGDGGSVAGDGGDGGPADSGEGGPDGGDAGSTCNWRDAGDAGLCTDDSQCPDSGFYCDFTVTDCPADGFSTVNQGRCLPACPATAMYSGTPGASCEVNEDCAPYETCGCVEPCDAGNCYLIGSLVCGASFPLPPSCQAISVPHSPIMACVCSGNTCVPDAGSLVDGGSLPDAGDVPASSSGT